MALLALLSRFPAARKQLLQSCTLAVSKRITAEDDEAATAKAAAAAAAQQLKEWTASTCAAIGRPSLLQQLTFSESGDFAASSGGAARVRGEDVSVGGALQRKSKEAATAGVSAVDDSEKTAVSAKSGGGGRHEGSNKPVAATAPPASAKVVKLVADGGVPDASTAVNFLKQIVEADLQTGKHKTVVTRFPPEPNGFLHLGHAKSICVNFGLANAFRGRCHLRFDDTNPMKEETRYIESIQRDVKWLGGDWGDHLYYASDYFEQLYQWAEDLIRKDLAFVDSEDLDTIREKRGSITRPGQNSIYRNRSVQENLILFRRMRAGDFAEGSCVLRAKIDMAHSNVNMRDPIMYRILKKEHPRTGNQWVIYPMYDYAHGQSDSIEAITHSICTLEFELHRPLYDWFQEKLEICRTRQIEFARLNVTYTVMSKRKLLALVTEKWVEGWDDPRLPTLSGLRRRGVPASALRDFCEKVGVARRESTIQVELLEKCIREALHAVALRRFAVQQPLLLTITNFEGTEEIIQAPNHPENPSFGTRILHFTSRVYIDREDFMEQAPPGYHRLSPGAEVRLKHAYWVKCNEVRKDAAGQVIELRCTYDSETKDRSVAPDGRKVKGTIQWLSEKDAAFAELRIYGRLFTKANPEEADDTNPDATWRDFINPDSLKMPIHNFPQTRDTYGQYIAVYKGLVERSVVDTEAFPPQNAVQFERMGFFTRDKTTLPECAAAAEAEKAKLPTFNLTIALQESFASTEDSGKEKAKALDQMARQKAALERQRKKEEKLEKQRNNAAMATTKREFTVCS